MRWTSCTMRTCRRTRSSSRKSSERWKAIEALTDKYGPKPLGREDPGPDAVTVLRLSTERLFYR